MWNFGIENMYFIYEMEDSDMKINSTFEIFSQEIEVFSHMKQYFHVWNGMWNFLWS